MHDRVCELQGAGKMATRIAVLSLTVLLVDCWCITLLGLAFSLYLCLFWPHFGSGLLNHGSVWMGSTFPQIKSPFFKTGLGRFSRQTGYKILTNQRGWKKKKKASRTQTLLGTDKSAEPSACILPLVYVRTLRITVRGREMSFTRSTYTFALEWVQEVPAHFAVISRRSRRVVHAPHVIRRALEEEKI